MRLLTKFSDQSQAHTFIAFLQSKGIEAQIEEKEQQYVVWIYNEDAYDIAREYYMEFIENPKDIKIEIPSGSEEHESKSFEVKLRPFVFLEKKRTMLTYFIIGLCVFIYVLNFMQRTTPSGILLNFTPVTKTLLYDFPPQMQKIADRIDKYGIKTQQEYEALSDEEKKELEAMGEQGYWRGGYYALLNWPDSKKDLDQPMFTDIRKGEVWRLISPVVLHVDFLHILFNMLWLFYLGRMVEERISPLKYLALALVIGICSNTLQYLASGPFFMGYSGIVVGLAGFIWMRQKIAPWEGYPLQRGVLIFLMVFVIGMTFLQLASFIFIRFHIAEFDMNIANTAHISGGILGMVMGRLSFFNKGIV